MICRVHLLTINPWRNTEEMIAPFRPPNIEKRRREARESPRIEIDGGRFRNLI
jgi:hypothetical protein